jgi:ethanolamine ammonia-lyase small subunit
VTAPAGHDPWLALRRFTQARIALGRAGVSLPTEAALEFGLAHARAKDAVHLPLDRDKILAELDAAGFEHLLVHSAAPDRSSYLRRPDLGRRLDLSSREALGDRKSASRPDVVFVIADGLSSCGVAAHAVALLREVVARLPGWRLAPVVVAEQSRVALGDEIGDILEAEQVVMLIGERPGLSSPDSVGIYLTYAPHVGRNDAERNCISNVRPEGLSFAAAADRLAYLLNAARQLRFSGVKLKDESGLLLPPSPPPSP